MSLGTYGINDWLRSDAHKYYTQEDSVSEVTIYKHIPDSRTSDLIFFQVYVSCVALPTEIHRLRASPEKQSLESTYLLHLLALSPYKNPLKKTLSHY
jgi:hypothetical protein